MPNILNCPLCNKVLFKLNFDDRINYTCNCNDFGHIAYDLVSSQSISYHIKYNGYFIVGGNKPGYLPKFTTHIYYSYKPRQVIELPFVNLPDNNHGLISTLNDIDSKYQTLSFYI